MYGPLKLIQTLLTQASPYPFPTISQHFIYIFLYLFATFQIMMFEEPIYCLQNCQELQVFLGKGMGK